MQREGGESDRETWQPLAPHGDFNIAACSSFHPLLDSLLSASCRCPKGSPRPFRKRTTIQRASSLSCTCWSTMESICMTCLRTSHGLFLRKGLSKNGMHKSCLVSALPPDAQEIDTCMSWMILSREILSGRAHVGNCPVAIVAAPVEHQRRLDE